MNQVRKKLKQQESIPVGCVPPTSVATTRCQHCTFCTLQAVTFWGVPFGCVPSKGCTFQRVCLLRGYLVGLVPSGGASSTEVPSGGSVLGVYLPWYTPPIRNTPWKVHSPGTPPLHPLIYTPLEGTWDQAYPPPVGTWDQAYPFPRCTE